MKFHDRTDINTYVRTALTLDKLVQAEQIGDWFMIWATSSDLLQILIDYDLLTSVLYFFGEINKYMMPTYILHLPNSGGISSKLISVIFTFFLEESILLKCTAFNVAACLCFDFHTPSTQLWKVCRSRYQD